MNRGQRVVVIRKYFLFTQIFFQSQFESQTNKNSNANLCLFANLEKQAHLTFSTSIHRRHAAGPEDLGRGSNQCGAGVAECDGTSDANRLIGEVVQSRRRPLLGPSPG